MILFLVFVLVALWLLGMVTTTMLGGYLHILLVIAVIFLLIRLIQGPRHLAAAAGGTPARPGGVPPTREPHPQSGARRPDAGLRAPAHGGGGARLARRAVAAACRRNGAAARRRRAACSPPASSATSTCPDSIARRWTATPWSPTAPMARAPTTGCRCGDRRLDAWPCRSTARSRPARRCAS